MKKFLKVFLSLMLVVALSSSSTITSFAASSSKGGTWRITDMVSSEPLSYEDIPIKVTYLPFSAVKSLYETDLKTDNTSDLLGQYGTQFITTSMAKKVLKKYAIDLSALVGYSFVLYDLYQAAITDSFNEGINTAYNASKGMKMTVYEVSGGDKFFRCTKWSGKSMPEKIYFTNISGYAIGEVAIGEHDLELGW